MKALNVLIIVILNFNNLLYGQVTSDLLVQIHNVTTSEMNALMPEKGALSYNTDESKLYQFDGTNWITTEKTTTLTNNGDGTFTYTNEIGDTTSFTPTTSTASTIMVDQSFLAKASVSGDGNQPNQILTLTSQRADTGWNISGNQVVFNDIADYVKINAMVYMQQNQNSAYARINPELELLKNGTVVAKSGTGYQRHATGHDSSSNTISYIDHTPSSGDTYELRAQQGSSQNDVLNIDLGHIDLVAIKKITVINSITTN